MIDSQDLRELRKKGYNIDSIGGWADRALSIFNGKTSKEANYVADLIEQIRDECEAFDIDGEEQ